jgi:hypothetical protein
MGSVPVRLAAHASDETAESVEGIIGGLLKTIADLFSRFMHLTTRPVRMPPEVSFALQDLCVIQELLLEEFRRRGPNAPANLAPPLDPESFRRDALEKLRSITERLWESGITRVVDAQ